MSETAQGSAAERRLRAVPAWVVPITAAVTSIAIVIIRFRMWHFDLRVPLTYSGDALQFHVLVKALTEGFWNYHIARLGAPFGMEAVDFSIGCTLDFAVMKLMVWILRDPFLVVNLYWLASVGLAGACAALLFRYLQISRPMSVAFGALYAIIPFVFLRNIAHLNLVTFIVPVGAYLAISVANGESLIVPSAAEARRRFPRFKVIALLACVAVGLSYIYWAFFTCIAVSIGCLIGLVRFKRLNVAATAGVYMLVITLCSLLNISASLSYWNEHGKNPELGYKFAAETDTFGLRIRQMLLPIPDHPIPAWRRLREEITSENFPTDNNESVTAALGTIGSIAFLIVVYGVVTQTWASARIFDDARMKVLSGIALGLVLTAHVGGFGSLFNALVTPDFRAYNRVSPFVSLFSFAVLAIMLDRYCSWVSTKWRVALAAVAVAFAAVDQIPVAVFGAHERLRSQFHQDRDRIRALESTVPSGTMVFQLPHTEFPMDPGVRQLGPYANAIPYLHSKTLRWSWGTMMGRHDNWARFAAGLPPEELLRTLVFSGFRGLMLDRRGYADSNFEHAVSNLLEPHAAMEMSRDWVYFDLTDLARKLTAEYSADEWQNLQSRALSPIRIVWGDSFSIDEAGNGRRWRWCGKRGTIRFVNGSKAARTIEVSGWVHQYSPGQHGLTITRAGAQMELQLGAVPVAYRDKFVLPPNSRIEIAFDFAGPLLHEPADPRPLAFQLIDFEWHEARSGR